MDAEKTANSFTAEEVIFAMDAIKGENRVAYQCEWCGQFIGRRFIPFGLGRGLTVNPCWCYTTQQNHVPLKEVMRVIP